jgi:hypothetical protein
MKSQTVQVCRTLIHFFPMVGSANAADTFNDKTGYVSIFARNGKEDKFAVWVNMCPLTEREREKKGAEMKLACSQSEHRHSCKDGGAAQLCYKLIQETLETGGGGGGGLGVYPIPSKVPVLTVY